VPVPDVRDAVILDARHSLEHHVPLAQAQASVPASPGLYGIYGDPATWRELGLGDPPDGRPLYIGKSEDDLVTRDLKTHFGDGRTGSSTVRRSFAALLRDSLGLRGVPRNPAKPGYFANYGLEPADDATLTRWMRQTLSLAVWPRPHTGSNSLTEIEKALLAELSPPLNVKDVVTPWTARVKAARAVMAAEARAWAESR
jgi:hypothetical protein